MTDTFRCDHCRSERSTTYLVTLCVSCSDALAAPSPSPSSAPRPECDHARDDSYHCPKCWAAPASPQGERERALEEALRELFEGALSWNVDPTDGMVGAWFRWPVDYQTLHAKCLAALAASSPHYAEKGD